MKVFPLYLNPEGSICETDDWRKRKYFLFCRNYPLFLRGGNFCAAIKYYMSENKMVVLEIGGGGNIIIRDKDFLLKNQMPKSLRYMEKICRQYCSQDLQVS